MKEKKRGGGFSFKNRNNNLKVTNNNEGQKK